ncbi:hypothetical protein, partial [Clostridioides difficile]|uniref:hypothetical protein n=1 Tax=Clostridioides difficile TaxID=1496 RepID=UPI0013EFB12A
MEKSNTTVTKKEKIEDIGMKLEHLLSEDITFYELLLEILYKEKEDREAIENMIDNAYLKRFLKEEN